MVSAQKPKNLPWSVLGASTLLRLNPLSASSESARAADLAGCRETSRDMGNDDCDHATASLRILHRQFLTSDNCNATKVYRSSSDVYISSLIPFQLHIPSLSPLNCMRLMFTSDGKGTGNISINT